jgi:hypothetical protein
MIERPMATKNDMMPSLDANVDLNAVSDIVAFQEEGDKQSVVNENNSLGGLVSYIQKKYFRARERRMSDEARWINCYQNYRGIYGPDVQFTDTEKSRAFIKITKTKVAAAHAQVVDVLFAGGRFPIGIEPSPVVTGVAEAVYFDPKEKAENTAAGAAKGQIDPNQNVKGASARSSTIARQEIIDAVGPYKDQLDRVKEKLHEGYGSTPSAMTFEPAVQAAKNMEKMILDQLEEAEASKHLRALVFDMSLYGTGVMKGPFALDKEYPKWADDGKYQPVIKTIPDIMAVSVWDAYPDPDARIPAEIEHFIERHRFSRTQLRALKRRPHFRTQSIELAITAGANYINEYWEQQISDRSDTETDERYEVLEYWGNIDKDLAVEANLTIPQAMEKFDEFQVNVWTCNNQILRLVLNPFTPARIPYHIVPYEMNPYNIFGIGIAENMLDTQLAMNGSFRLAIDNAVLSSNLVFEVDETNLVPGQDLKIYPGKIFRRQAGAPGQAIFSTKFQNVTNECFVMFDKARQLADEATGMPSYAHGQTSVGGVGRTAAGMSMLMGAAAQNIKSVVRNIDDYLLAPLGKALFAFNMQFNFDKKLQGDLEVVARGTESLMRNEVRSQKLLQFLQLTANPMDAPFAKRDYLLRELAASLDLDPDKAVNDPREAAIQATMMNDMATKMGAANPQGNPQQPQGGATPKPSDPTQTGGGNIGPGAAPTPGEAGYASNGGQGGNPNQGQPQQ